MEFFDKLGKKASEAYKGAAEKTSKLTKEAKLRLKINDNKSKIKDAYEEIGKKVYQRHISDGEVCIKDLLEEDCKKIDELSDEIEGFEKEILELRNFKQCEECKEKIDKEAKFCPKCGAEQPIIEEKKEDEALEGEVITEDNNQNTENNESENQDQNNNEN